MRLFAIGLSHRTAPIELRERVDFSSRGAAEALSALAARGITAETVVLSTCNRAEIYALAPPDGPDAVGRFFGDYHEVPLAQLADHLYVRRGADVPRHLFRVAAGLDSLVVGEPQILGQLKAAYAVASESGHTGAVLNRLFHTAFGAGKRVRRETGLSEGAVSVSYAAVALARKIFGDMAGLHVVVVGAGDMAKLTAVHLQAQGVRQLTIASRTLPTAERLAAELSGRAVPWSELGEALRGADIVITATGASTPVLTRSGVQDVMRTRPPRPLFIIDIAVPRDVDAAAGELEHVFLYNIDDLQGIVRDNLSRRSGELDRAEAIVGEEVDRFQAWMQAREVIPTVVALRDRFEHIRQAEIARLESKLAGLPPEARERVDEITRLMIEKLLIVPTERLKAIRDSHTIGTYAEVLNELFRLERDEPPGDRNRSPRVTPLGRR